MLGALGLGIVGYAEMGAEVRSQAAPQPSDLFACPNSEHHDGDAIRCRRLGSDIIGVARPSGATLPLT